jgi:hypothetical protein
MSDQQEHREELAFLAILHIASFIESVADLFAWRAVSKRHLLVLNDQESGTDAKPIWQAIVRRHFGDDCISLATRAPHKFKPAFTLAAVDFLDGTDSLKKARLQQLRNPQTLAYFLNSNVATFQSKFDSIKGILSNRYICL